MLRRYFCPSFRFEKFKQVTPEFLLSEGIRALILDIDNTIAPYEVPEPDEEAVAWFSALREAGIRVAFVSNNHAPRVELFNQKLGFPCFPDAGKPLKKNMRRAMQAMNASPSETAIMGDQVFTDVWAGRHIGIRTILVPPIKDKRDIFTRTKRLLERPVLRYYDRKCRSAK